MKNRRMILVYVWSLTAFFFAGCSPKTYEVIDRSCSSCHDASVVYEKKRTQVDWERVMFAMKARGMKISLGDERRIMEFLSRSYTLKEQRYLCRCIRFDPDCIGFIRVKRSESKKSRTFFSAFPY